MLSQCLMAVKTGGQLILFAAWRDKEAVAPRLGAATCTSWSPISSSRGDNGKTKLMHTVMQLLGPALVHAQRVEDLDKSRFAMGSLYGKFLFVDDDVRAEARLPDGILKTISEGKQVTGELKFGSVFNFVVRAVPV